MSDRSGRRVLADGRHLRFVLEAGWEFVERPACTGIAVIVALTPDGRLLLVEQFRPALRCRVLELPAGLAGDEAGQRHESLETAAARELLEETGYAAERLERLAAGPPSAGLSSEVVTFFRASGLRQAGPGGGAAGESIVVHEVPLEQVDAWLRDQEQSGRLVDPKVYSGLYLLDRER